MISETEIIRGCKKGSSEAQANLYIRFGPLLKGICIRYIKDRELAADVLQDSFVKIYTKIKDFDERGSFEGWLRRIAVNTALDFLRSKSKTLWEEMPEHQFAEVENQFDDNSLIEKALKAGFSSEMLVQMLQQIPENYSQVFNMYYLDGMQHKEIAELLNITENSSRKWAFRAKDCLRKKLLSHMALHQNEK